jgi:hypothetical protein
MRDTSYATEIAHASFVFPGGSEGRIERLRFKEGNAAGKEGYRFSWWKDGRMTPRPLDACEDELLVLLASAIKEGVFTETFVSQLRTQLVSPAIQ